MSSWTRVYELASSFKLEFYIESGEEFSHL